MSAHPTPLAAPLPLSPAAEELVRSGPVFDAHVDTIQRALDLGDDLGQPTRGHLDLVRGRAGGLGAVVLVAWVDPKYTETPGASAERARALMGASHALAARHPEQLSLVGDGASFDEARSRGAIAGLCGIEGGHALEEDLGRLEHFHEHGLRILTLVWNNHLSWVRSCKPGAGAGVPAGLSEFGRQVVRRMNELGVIVDLSHACERAFYDALEASEKPVVASHSGCHALHAHERNLTDAQLVALGQAGGVVGVVFHPGFLDAEARLEEERVRASDAYRAHDAEPNETERFLAQSECMRREAAPMPAQRLVEHVMHAIELAGVEHVGVGSDFDGIERGPQSLEDASCYGSLAELLLQRGLSVDQVRGVLGGNLRRVFAEVTGPGSASHGRAIRALT